MRRTRNSIYAGGLPTTEQPPVTVAGEVGYYFDTTIGLLMESRSTSAWAPLFASIVVGANTSVANIAALSALSDLLLNDGATVSVATVEDDFVLSTGLALTEDGITVAPAFTAGRQWARKGASSARWAQQTDWRIDPVAGNDENDGLTLATALLTLDELSRRWGGQLLVDGVLVTIAPGTVASPNSTVSFRVRSSNGHRLTIVGTRTIVDTGQVTGVSVETDVSATILSDGTFGSFAPYVFDTQLVGTSGAINARVAWVINDFAVNQAEVSRFTSETGATTEPAPGDTFDVATVPVVNVGLYFENYRSGDGDPALKVKDLNLAGGLHFGQPAGDAMATSFEQIDVVFCFVGSRLTTNANIALTGSNVNDGMIVKGATALIKGGAFATGAFGGTETFVDGGGELFFDAETVTYSSRFRIMNGSIRFGEASRLSAFGRNGGIDLYDEATVAFEGSTASTYRGLFGGDAAAMRFAAGARAFYSDAGAGTLGAVAVAQGMGGAGAALVLNTAAPQTFASIPGAGFSVPNQGIELGPVAAAFATWARQ